MRPCTFSAHEPGVSKLSAQAEGTLPQPGTIGVLFERSTCHLGSTRASASCLSTSAAVRQLWPTHARPVKAAVLSMVLSAVRHPHADATRAAPRVHTRLLLSSSKYNLLMPPWLRN